MAFIHCSPFIIKERKLDFLNKHPLRKKIQNFAHFNVNADQPRLAFSGGSGNPDDRQMTQLIKLIKKTVA